MFYALEWAIQRGLQVASLISRLALLKRYPLDGKT